MIVISNDIIGRILTKLVSCSICMCFPEMGNLVNVKGIPICVLAEWQFSVQRYFEYDLLDFPKLNENNHQYKYEMKCDKKAADQIEKYKQIIVPILMKNDVDKAGIFGSFARDEANEDSDIDILVHFKGRKSLFDLARLELELERESRRKVDVITYDSINPLIREHILKEEIKIL